MINKKYQFIIPAILTAILSMTVGTKDGTQPARSVRSDFDGDGYSDIGVFRFIILQWGLPNDIPLTRS